MQGTGQESAFLCAKAISLTILKNSSNFSGLFSPRHHLVLSEVSQGGTQSRYCSVSLFTFELKQKISFFIRVHWCEKGSLYWSFSLVGGNDN